MIPCSPSIHLSRSASSSSWSWCCSAARRSRSWPRTSARRRRSSRTDSTQGRDRRSDEARRREPLSAPVAATEIDKPGEEAGRRARGRACLSSWPGGSGERDPFEPSHVSDDGERRLRMRRRSRSTAPPHTPWSMRLLEGVLQAARPRRAVGADLAGHGRRPTPSLGKNDRRGVVAAVALAPSTWLSALESGLSLVASGHPGGVVHRTRVACMRRSARTGPEGSPVLTVTLTRRRRVRSVPDLQKSTRWRGRASASPTYVIVCHCGGRPWRM